MMIFWSLIRMAILSRKTTINDSWIFSNRSAIFVFLSKKTCCILVGILLFVSPVGMIIRILIIERSVWFVSRKAKWFIS